MGIAIKAPKRLSQKHNQKINSNGIKKEANDIFRRGPSAFLHHRFDHPRAKQRTHRLKGCQEQTHQNMGQKRAKMAQYIGTKGGFFGKIEGHFIAIKTQFSKCKGLPKKCAIKGFFLKKHPKYRNTLRWEDLAKN